MSNRNNAFLKNYKTHLETLLTIYIKASESEKSVLGTNYQIRMHIEFTCFYSWQKCKQILFIHVDTMAGNGNYAGGDIPMLYYQFNMKYQHIGCVSTFFHFFTQKFYPNILLGEF